MLRLSTLFAVLVILTAWFIFLFSFFLPASNAFGGKAAGAPISGWETFTAPLVMLAAQPLVILAEPRILMFLAFPLINLVMLLSPLVVFGEHERAPLLAFVLIPFSLLPLTLPKTLTGDLFIGFYAWIGSFFLMSVGCIWLGWAARPVFPDESELSSERTRSVQNFPQAD